MNIKKFIVGTATGVLLLGASVFPAFADAGDVTIWDMTGNYTIDFTCVTGCAGTYTHTMHVTSMDMDTGDFSGNGEYPADPSYTWDMTGNVGGATNDISMTITYTGTGAGYVLTPTGHVAADGKLSGTATDSLARTFTWQSTSGKAMSKRLHRHQEANKKQCEGKGQPIINITEKVINDADSGFAGYWAFDKYTRRIKVWKTATVGTYCAIGDYDGKFDAVAGQTGPAGTGTIGAFVDGNFTGGFRSIEFTGTLLASPLWPTTGFVGTVDYNCNISGICPGYVNWRDKYFSSTNFDYAWWGWTYKAGKKHGTWINASTGNSGNIL